MSFDGYRAGVVGGSIAGCAAAIALCRNGFAVDVFERTSGVLQDRGAGIAIPLALRDELISTGYLPPDYPNCPLARRRWYLRDGGAPAGKMLWDQPSPAAANNWGLLFRSLRSQLADDHYHDATIVTALVPTPDGVRVAFGDREPQAFDLVVGADGYRSMVRGHLHPDSAPDYAGYVLWRGNYEEARVEDRRLLDDLDADHAWATVCFQGGHGVFYMIPGFDNSSAVGHRRVNWAVYAPAPPHTRFDEPGSVAPGQVGAALVDELWRLVDRDFPPAFATLIRHTGADEVSIQPIYDEAVPAYTDGRIMLIGDAGTVTRPHTGSGATKALQDARTVERIFADSHNLDIAIAAYDSDRAAAGNSLVQLGRNIGAAQVEHTPDWGSMTHDDFEAWTAATLAGQTLYLYGNQPDEP